MNNLLISEPPLQVLPSLAVKVGLNEAIILQQFHYWLQRSSNVKDGYKWIYNSYSEWNKQFPFWGRNTLIRAINSLEKQGYLISANYNTAGFDKTKWYRINYGKLVDDKASTQNGQTSNPKWASGSTQNGQTNTNRLPETTSINKIRSGSDEPDNIPYKPIVDYLNSKADTKYRYQSKKTQSLIKARVHEGFKLDDFKKVIDHKVQDWKTDEKMVKFLRPETLFGTKFESYLNEKPAKSGVYQNRGEDDDQEYFF